MLLESIHYLLETMQLTEEESECVFYCECDWTRERPDWAVVLAGG